MKDNVFFIICGGVLIRRGGLFFFLSVFVLKLIPRETRVNWDFSSASAEMCL